MIIDFTERLKKIESVLEKELPAQYTDLWLEKTFSQLPTSIKTELMDNLVQPCRNLLMLGGKRWRPLFMILCAELSLEQSTFSDNEKQKILERVYALTPMVEFVHTASLIHDDIEDAADMRRGKPSAYITHGLDTALNAGSWLYFHASRCLSHDTLYWNKNSADLKLRLFEQLNLELRRLHLGQAMDITWHKNNELVPNMDEYLTMTSLKTGTLASLSARLGLLAAEESLENADKIAFAASQIGVAFQILDDVKNLTTGNVGKKRGDDIVEGKKSLPILLHLETKPEDFSELMSCFKRARAEGISSTSVEEAIAIIKKSNAIEKAQKKGEELILSSCEVIKKLYPHAETTNHIDALFKSMF